MTPQEQKAHLEEIRRQHEARRCTFTYADGRRCRMLRMTDHEDLCPYHVEQRERDEKAVRAGRRLVGMKKGTFESAVGINHALENVFRAVAERRMPAKDAALLAYIAQVQLSTIPHMQREMQILGAGQAAIVNFFTEGGLRDPALTKALALALKNKLVWEQDPKKETARKQGDAGTNGSGEKP
jgi:hypothetical protein